MKRSTLIKNNILGTLITTSQIALLCLGRRCYQGKGFRFSNSQLFLNYFFSFLKIFNFSKKNSQTQNQAAVRDIAAKKAQKAEATA